MARDAKALGTNAAGAVQLTWMLAFLPSFACAYAVHGRPAPPKLQVSSVHGRALPPTMQVNSDSRATQEYFDFLLGKVTQEVTEDGPSVIVGNGRIGSMLLDFGSRRGFEDTVVERGELIPEDHTGPVYLCVPAPDLEAVIAACPESKRDDLVFLSDGHLEPLFQRNGIYGPTQASLWLACMRKGGKPVDGSTVDAPEGLTTVSGKWSGAMAMRMSTGNMACHVKMDRDGRRAQLEKLVRVWHARTCTPCMYTRVRPHVYGSSCSGGATCTPCTHAHVPHVHVHPRASGTRMGM